MKVMRGNNEGRWVCEALTASTVGMGGCQAAAKYTLGSVPRLCQSQASGFLIKRAFCSLKSSDSCDRREVAGWGPRWMCVFEDLTCRKLIGTRQRSGRELSQRPPQTSKSQKDWGCPALSCLQFFFCVKVNDKTTLQEIITCVCYFTHSWTLISFFRTCQN